MAIGCAVWTDTFTVLVQEPALITDDAVITMVITSVHGVEDLNVTKGQLLLEHPAYLRLAGLVCRLGGNGWASTVTTEGRYSVMHDGGEIVLHSVGVDVVVGVLLKLTLEPRLYVLSDDADEFVTVRPILFMNETHCMSYFM